jgi:hypothetical protein
MINARKPFHIQADASAPLAIGAILLGLARYLACALSNCGLAQSFVIP